MLKQIVYIEIGWTGFAARNKVIRIQRTSKKWQKNFFSESDKQNKFLPTKKLTKIDSENEIRLIICKFLDQ